VTALGEQISTPRAFAVVAYAGIATITAHAFPTVAGTVLAIRSTFVAVLTLGKQPVGCGQ
jgi:hypothetical protein